MCNMEAAIPKDVNKRLMRKAELLWDDLEKNKLGGLSGINRPFWIIEILKEVWLEGAAYNQENR